MAANRNKLAKLLGARIIGQMPDAGGGAFGVARMAKRLHERLTPSPGAWQHAAARLPLRLPSATA